MQWGTKESWNPSRGLCTNGNDHPLIHLPIHPSIHPPTHSPFHLYLSNTHPSIHPPPTHLPTHPFTHLFILQSVHLSTVLPFLPPGSLLFSLPPLHPPVVIGLYYVLDPVLSDMWDLCLSPFSPPVSPDSHPGQYSDFMSSLNFCCLCSNARASQVVLVVKNPYANAGDIRDMGSISGSSRYPGRGRVNPLQYSCLENPME